MIATVIVSGASFDTGGSPEATCELLARAESPVAPIGSWLRLRDMELSAVHDASGEEVRPWPAARPAASLAARRAALSALRAHGYRLIAFVRWPADSWKNGVRSDQPLRRLPIDLREAHERARLLAATYGDLIDYWEIENEPDISFVEENPETYAAFLKACYLGFRKAAERGNGKEGGLGSERLPPAGSPSPTAPRVLAAAFALPPGPYFDAWVANDGLRYTDGFNYHYYGYAADFTGVYQQFEEAVSKAISPATADETVLQTNFYPSGNAWQARTLFRFAPSEASVAGNRVLLQSRALAAEEPALQEQGRWLVTTGTSVKETAEGWEFTVTRPADGPLRPAMAELPWPDEWSAPADASLAFEYRTVGAALGKREAENGKGSDATLATPSHPLSVIGYPPLPVAASHLPATRVRELPVFLTEYGYGLLDKDARHTPAGREAQRTWFASVQSQIAALKIEGPMAFILRPYLEADKNEFGLLIAPSDGRKSPPPVSPPSSLGGYAVSPALADLLATGASPVARPWTVAQLSPSSVVMDIVGGQGLQMSKAHRGYALETDQGEATLLVYNFGPKSVSGELILEGQAWVLSGGARAIRLTLAPGSRHEVPLTVRPLATARFGAQIGIARFHLSEGVSAIKPVISPPVLHTRPSELGAERPAGRTSVGPPVPAEAADTCDVYLRTANGNLYHTWPRLQARGAWQWYAQSLTDFTPAFFARAHVPAALSANKPAALVFFFRPDKYPATYQIRHAQMLEYIRKTGDWRWRTYGG